MQLLQFAVDIEVHTAKRARTMLWPPVKIDVPIVEVVKVILDEFQKFCWAKMRNSSTDIQVLAVC